MEGRAPLDWLDRLERALWVLVLLGIGAVGAFFVLWLVALMVLA